ncbi:interleukin-23 p19 [Triplophysa rosa]|uniref:Interleukin-23 p19 n=1 Tax=Triplophysa rosa TaxID=992332 RepID=A0A9W7TDV9_TRIRA|nr:interleukin-23 p19 [Triplophysa rosa]
MDRSLLLGLALSVFSCARCTPVARASAEVNYIQCRVLSLKLNEIARDLYNKVEPPNVTANISDPPVSVRQIDACDPWSLETNKGPCQSRIILALRNYTSIFHKDGVFKNSACSKWSEQANEIADVTENLLRALKQPVVDRPSNTVGWHVWWHDSALCRDSVERLYSFSIMSARVFSFLASPLAPKMENKQC